MGEAIVGKLEGLKWHGVGVRMNTFAKIAKPEVVELDDFCRLCDFTFIYGGNGVYIGKYSDFQPNAVIWGGGAAHLGDRVSVGPGTVIITGKFLFKEPGLKMVDGLEEDATKAVYGRVEIQNDVYIGANCTILSDVVIGEGSVIGANSLVNKDVPPWSVMVGSPCKRIGERPREK